MFIAFSLQPQLGVVSPEVVGLRSVFIQDLLVKMTGAIMVLLVEVCLGEGGGLEKQGSSHSKQCLRDRYGLPSALQCHRMVF